MSKQDTLLLYLERELMRLHRELDMCLYGTERSKWLTERITELQQTLITLATKKDDDASLG